MKRSREDVADYWQERKFVELHDRNQVAPRYSVLDVRRGVEGRKYIALEWAVFYDGERIADGFINRESAVAYALSKWNAAEGRGSEPLSPLLQE